MERTRGRHRMLGGTAILLALVGALAVGCTSAPASSPATPSTGAPSTPVLTVVDAWARPAAVGADTAAYLTIRNQGAADVLLSVRCTIAGSTMLHRTATDGAGMTGMSMLDTVSVPAGATVRLEPGGTHLMIGGLTHALAPGESLQLELLFEHAGAVVVPAAIRPG